MLNRVVFATTNLLPVMRVPGRRGSVIGVTLALTAGLTACSEADTGARTNERRDSVRPGVRALLSADSTRNMRRAWLSLADDSLTIGSRTTDSDLDRVFGAMNVRRMRAEIGEGETLPVTVLYPDDSQRRIEIFWIDTIARERPARLRISGTDSRWSAGSVSVGTSLKELERINGRPFVMTGFGWDYAGTITSWNGGTLDTLPPGVERLMVRLAPATEATSDSLKGHIAGDREFPSTNPILQRLNPRAYAVEVWYQP